MLGLPNAGKSSFLNRLAGEDLAIVSPKAQTTWRILRGHVVRPGLELVLVDTPGVQEGSKALNLALARNAIRAVTAAKEGRETVALLVDAKDLFERLKAGKPTALEAISRVLEREGIRLPLAFDLIATLNKSDLVKKPEDRARVEAHMVEVARTLAAAPKPCLWVSSRTGEGIDDWVTAASRMFPQAQSGALFEQDTLSDRNMRDFVAEYVREQCFLQLGEELPYSTAVQIENFDEKDPRIIRIEAVLHVEQESQKRIVVGSGGSKIKSIGTRARERIEAFLGRKVFLGLRVKVSPHWAREESQVKRFGYAE